MAQYKRRSRDVGLELGPIAETQLSGDLPLGLGQRSAGVSRLSGAVAVPGVLCAAAQG